MIDKGELRIGNLINTPFGYKKVFGIKTQPALDGELVFIYYSYQESVLLRHCDGIALTPEILERCGGEINLACFTIGINDGDIVLWNNGVFEGKLIDNFPIEYLHQLQNFYLCLCGKELIVNLYESAAATN